MSTPWTFSERLAAYRAEGIAKIVVMSGAQTHNRDAATGRTFGPVHGVTIHHTAGVGSGMAQFCYNGNPSLPGPLCHDFLAKDGTLYVVGHGRTNHAGTVTPAVKAAIINEQAPASQKNVGSETEDGNDFLHGLEIENLGNGSDPYPAQQYEVAVRWAAAHARHYGWSVNSVWGHKEITSRKIDPSFNMNTFRSAVGARLNQEEEDMTPEQAAQLQKLYDDRKVSPWQYKNPNTSMGDRDALQVLLDGSETTEVEQLRGAVMTLAETVQGIRVELSRLQAGGTVDSAAIAEAVADELHRRTES